MKFNENLNVDYAVDALVRGKKGVCALMKDTNGELLFVGLGLKYLPVLKLWMKVGNEYFDESTFDDLLIMRRSRKSNMVPAWYVLEKKDGTEVATSEYADVELCCIALVKPSREQMESCSDPELKEVPYCLKVKFDATCAAVALLQDVETFKMWVAEGNEMEASARSSIHVVDQPATEFDYPQEKLNYGAEHLMAQNVYPDNGKQPYLLERGF